MQGILAQFAENLSLIGAYVILAYAISQARRVSNDVMTNIDKFGSDNRGKRIVAHKAVFNFYLILAAVIIIVAGSLTLISTELFVGLLVSILTALGIKLAADIREKPDKD